MGPAFSSVDQGKGHGIVVAGTLLVEAGDMASTPRDPSAKTCTSLAPPRSSGINCSSSVALLIVAGLSSSRKDLKVADGPRPLGCLGASEDGNGAARQFR